MSQIITQASGSVREYWVHTCDALEIEPIKQRENTYLLIKSFPSAILKFAKIQLAL